MGLRDYSNHWPLEKVKFMEEECFEKYRSELVTERSKQAFFRKQEEKHMQGFAAIPGIVETMMNIMEHTKKMQGKVRTIQDQGWRFLKITIVTISVTIFIVK